MRQSFEPDGMTTRKSQPPSDSLNCLSVGLALRICVSVSGIAGTDQIPARMPAISLALNARRYPQANNLGQPCFDFRLFSDAYGQSWTTAKQKVVSGRDSNCDVKLLKIFIKNKLRC
jgi:hypothetical protein